MDTDPVTETPLAAAAFLHGCNELEDDTSGHDAHHLRRVYRLATRIARAEGARLDIVQVIAALHDIADFKVTGDATSGPRAARAWLLHQGATEDFANSIAADIAGISFKGARTPTTPLSLEGQCVQDADRLDALGAIGIARCFTYGGTRSRPIHDPAVPVLLAENTTQYLQHKGTSLNHFYEKLFLLPERLHTDTARAIAADRVAFMEEYLDRFLQEWDGDI